jgi:hypothetical protein
MPFQEVEITAPQDLNVDISPYELPPTVWSSVVNANYDSSGTKRVMGATQVYPTLPIQPIFALPWNDGSGDTWLYSNLATIRKINASGVSTTMVSGLTSTFPRGWQGDVFNGVAVMNNGVNPPHYTNTVSTMVPLPAWPVGQSAKVVRPFQNHLIALNIETGAGHNRSRVHWSDSADVGTVPNDWDYADPASRSGINDLADTPGIIVDGKALGNTFIIYKEDAVWGMTYVGGTFVFNFRKIFDDNNGILAEGCVATFEGKHFVLTKSDAYVHNGISKQSVMTNRVRKLLASIDDELYERTKVIADNNSKEIIIYFVTSNDPTQTAREALTWNWETNSWGRRDLPNIAFLAEGAIDETASNVWDNDTDTWDSDPSLWNKQAAGISNKKILAVDYTNSKFLELNRGNTWDGVPYVTRLERLGVDFNSDSTKKRVKAIFPHLSGTLGSVVDVEIGYEDSPFSGATWEGPYPFRIGIDRKVDCRVYGRNLSIRFSSADDELWALHGYTVQWKPTRGTR